MTEILAIDELAIDYAVADRCQRAVDGASLRLAAGATIGVVGESGSGKSTLAAAVGRLLPGSARWSAGTITVAGVDIGTLRGGDLRRLRREQLGYVFQDPIGSLDPTMRVGRQLALALGCRPGAPEVAEHLRRVRLTDTHRIARAYPHELSGGMAQRVAVALALAPGPRLLIADEPTAALDTQVREEVLALVFGLAAQSGTSIMMLSHDLRAVQRYCDRIAVMYAGRVVEEGETAAVLSRPTHPYTVALTHALPGRAARGERLEPIPGQPPSLSQAAAGCAFAPRCPWAIERCANDRPGPETIDGRSVVCHRAADVSTGAATVPERRERTPTVTP